MNVTRLCLAILVIGQLLIGENASAASGVGLPMPRNGTIVVRVISATTPTPAMSSKRQTASKSQCACRH